MSVRVICVEREFETEARGDTREETRDRVEEAIVRVVECESFAWQNVKVPLMSGQMARETFARNGCGILYSNNAFWLGRGRFLLQATRI